MIMEDLKMIIVVVLIMKIIILIAIMGKYLLELVLYQMLRQMEEQVAYVDVTEEDNFYINNS